MPSKLKAGGTYPYVLPGDREEANPVTFHLHVLSCLQECELTDIRQEFFAGKRDKTLTAKEETQMLSKMLGVVVAKHPLGEGVDLQSVLTSGECWELIRDCINGTVLTEDERKKFVLPASSEADLAASGAVQSV